jgi:hypothetical protein
MSNYQQLKNNPPQLSIKGGAREVIFTTISCMCDNVGHLRFKKNEEGDFKLDGVDDRLSNSGFDPTNAGVLSTFTVALSTTSTLNTKVFLQQDQTTNSRIGQWARFSSGVSQSITFNTGQANFTANGAAVTSSVPYVYTSIRRPADLQSYLNGSTGGAVSTTGTPIFNPAAVVHVGRRTFGEALAGLMSEVVMYPLDQTTARAAIEQNIRNYYGF